mmetsp:Transcript_61507/g.109631  ORF Transcript_61507/g.109631 Transcript_61507/m.109631 type:complete len:236 (+) Transcript_61507:1121-1828(+)
MHLFNRPRWLQIVPTRVEAEALAHESQGLGGVRVSLVMHVHDPGLVYSSFANCVDHTHSLLLHLIKINDLYFDAWVFLAHFHRPVGHPAGGGNIRPLVKEVPCQESALGQDEVLLKGRLRGWGQESEALHVEAAGLITDEVVPEVVDLESHAGHEACWVDARLQLPMGERNGRRLDLASLQLLDGGGDSTPQGTGLDLLRLPNADQDDTRGLESGEAVTNSGLAILALKLLLLGL